MIKYIAKGDIFESKCDAYVNPVNIFGVMGAGLAADFKVEFPENFKVYNMRNKSVCLSTNFIFHVGSGICHTIDIQYALNGMLNRLNVIFYANVRICRDISVCSDVSGREQVANRA